MSTDDLVYLTAAEQSRRIRSHELSPVELTQAYLDRIERWNPVLNAYITVTGERALAAARRMEAEVIAGHDRGPLHGIPYGVKDQMYTAGVRTTAASRILADFVPDRNAHVIDRLDEAGAILIGKQNLDEWGKGGTVRHWFGQPRNPWNPLHTPSGSSSGSGVAAAAGLCSGSLGEDTGGSVRQPAAANGVVGLRPTFGRVSRGGAIMHGWNADTIGPLTRSVEDCALFLSAIAGVDPGDPLTSDRPVADYRAALTGDLGGLRIAIATELATDPAIDPEVTAAFTSAVDALRGLGATIEEVSIPLAEHSTTLVMLTSDADIAAVFLHRWLRDRWADFDVGTRRRLAVGCLIPAVVYSRAMRARVVVRAEILDRLQTYDALISPTNPMPPPRIDAGPGRIDASTNMGKVRRLCTYPFAVANTPTISVPSGFSQDGLPLALQIAGRPFAESTVFRIAHAFEQAHPWHQRHPDLEKTSRLLPDEGEQFAETTDETRREAQRIDLRLSDADVERMAAIVGLPLPEADRAEVAVRLSALLDDMEHIEEKLGSRLNDVDPIPPVYPRELF
ncbi:MAG: amidase [Chloroflexota bacterium]|nr:amidase [Chloroflexota bacterium]